VRYDIDLEISYAYTSTGDAGRHVLRMLPRHLPGEQRVIASSLNIRPEASERSTQTDFFGNSFVAVDFDGLQDEITFNARARVERELTSVPLDQSVSYAEVVSFTDALTDLGCDSPLHYLMASPYVPLHDSITEYAGGFFAGSTSVMSAVQNFGSMLFESMSYDPDATEVDTPVIDAFNNRHGVCQDYSHIMIAGLRGLGIPAGYVSGFLRTNVTNDEPDLEGADAMHAWVRVWCGGESGWVEYDPTNRMFATRDHVVIARARDYGDVSPVKGLMRTAGGQTSTQRVTVRSID